MAPPAGLNWTTLGSDPLHRHTSRYTANDKRKITGLISPRVLNAFQFRGLRMFPFFQVTRKQSI